MELDFKDLNIEELRDDINLFLWNNNFNTESMKATNEAIEKLKNVKIIIN